MPEYDLKLILTTLKEATIKPKIRLTTLRVECSQFDSKIGGTPYIPKDFEYPYSVTNPEVPLRLLAQINFEQMPKLEGFPTTGILQVFINDCEDSMYGCDLYSDSTEPLNYRIIYHKTIDYNANYLDTIPEIPECDSWSFVAPICCKLIPNLEYQGITIENEGFDTKLKEVLKRLYPNSTEQEVEDFIDDYDTLSDGYEQYIYTPETPIGGHAIGGYPYNIQGDPRSEERFEEYSTLLLQLDTDDDADMMFGDCGVANFFIKPQDLKDLNFNDVLYSWDCY